jgi:hypothetical protein
MWPSRRVRSDCSTPGANPAKPINSSALLNRSTGPMRATIDTADTTPIPLIASTRLASGEDW